MTDLEIYKSYQCDTPNAKNLSERVLCLPMYPELTIEQIKLIVNVIYSVVR